MHLIFCSVLFLLQILIRDDKGFFLMVEAGRVDTAHHETTARRALAEAVELDHTVEKIIELLGDQLDETLIIVTADHSHTMTIAGYPDRGTNIVGKGIHCA